MKRIYFLISMVISCSLLFFACASKGKESKVLIFDNLLIYAEGPLYEGSNTGQAEIASTLDSFLQANDLSFENITDMQVTGMELKVSDTANFNAYKSIGIQLASNESAMQNVAIINPIDSGLNTLNLKTASMQEDIKNILKDKVFFMVADAITKGDLEQNMQITGKLTLKINYNK